jgi:hypothetical protein
VDAHKVVAKVKRPVPFAGHLPRYFRQCLACRVLALGPALSSQAMAQHAGQ